MFGMGYEMIMNRGFYPGYLPIEQYRWNYYQHHHGLVIFYYNFYNSNSPTNPCIAVMQKVSNFVYKNVLNP